MAWTQADIDAIDLQIKSGAQSIRDGDQSLQRFSVDELFRIRAEMAAEVNATNGTPKIRQVRFNTSSGF